LKSDIEIAQSASIKEIFEIAMELDLNQKNMISYGHFMAKVPFTHLKNDPENLGKLILVTAMTPTSKGEGKTTNTIGLGQALKKIGKKSMIAIREPSLGPCLGVKGGAAGGGYSQVLPMEEINLHFTGDIHAVSIAHNLISAVIDNHIHQGNDLDINPRTLIWKRVMDMNDRSLRNILVGLQGQGHNGMIHEDGFEITAASEIMAILCLAKDYEDLKERIGNVIIGYSRLKRVITVKDLGVQGSVAALLKNAIHPNLVQSIEGVPTFVHGGPFANIAHGCNTMIATKMALQLADYVVTEAGFGADLGAEKFFNIKCRMGGLIPRAVVLVVTKRAYDLHGIKNIQRHIENLRLFGVPVVVSINKFMDDSLDELNEIKKEIEDFSTPASITDFREAGGEGGIELAEMVVDLANEESRFICLYPADWGIKEKIEIIATKIYRAKSVEFSKTALRQIKKIEDIKLGHLPVCMAKTPASFSDNPQLKGAPEDFTISISGAKASAGAGFVVAYTGKIMTMPGLPPEPSALEIDIDAQGNISGLF